ncbi:MAG: queuosine precursor transporter [Desulfurococcales archaeon]|nr:queuosine precursor transporter [Desulfurococcales archaeon]
MGAEREVYERRGLLLALLASFFVASLTASNLLASKIIEVKVGSIILRAPAAFIAYAATFLFTDIISEVFGRRAASLVVRAGFIAQLLVLFYIGVALKLPYSEVSPVAEQAYSSVVFSGTNIIAASLIAYLISQHHDVWAFHLWRRVTRGRYLWLRNNASTLVSQLIDTVLFITLAFSIIPGLHGENALPLNIVASIIAGQYLLKAIVALIDTPFVYLGVLLVNKYMSLSPPQPTTGLGTVKRID